MILAPPVSDPLNVVMPVFAFVNVLPVLSVPVPAKVMLLVPLMVVLPLSTKSLLKLLVKATSDFMLPPFKFNVPVPNGFVLSLLMSKIPLVKVISPERALLLPPKRTVPPLIVKLPAPLKSPAKLVMPVLVTLIVLSLFKVPVLLKVILLLPPSVTVLEALTIKLLLKVVFCKVSNVPPLKLSVPVPNGLVGLLICIVPLVKVVSPL